MSVTFEATQLAVELAEELGVDIQSVCEKALRTEIERRYKEEHREPIEAHNAWVEKHGLPLAKYRMF